MRLLAISYKLSFDKHISGKNLKKLIPLSRLNRYLKQNLKQLLFFSFTISQFNYYSFISIFWSKTSTRKLNVVFERSLEFILNDYKSPYRFVLQEVDQIKFHQIHTNSFIIEVYKFLNGYLLDSRNGIFFLMIPTDKNLSEDVSTKNLLK